MEAGRPVSRLYGLWLPNAQTFATYRGQVLVHDDGAALQRAFPACTVAPVPPEFGRSMLKINEHPDIAGTNLEVH